MNITTTSTQTLWSCCDNSLVTHAPDTHPFTPHSFVHPVLIHLHTHALSLTHLYTRLSNAVTRRRASIQFPLGEWCKYGISGVVKKIIKLMEPVGGAYIRVWTRRSHGVELIAASLKLSYVFELQQTVVKLAMRLTEKTQKTRKGQGQKNTLRCFNTKVISKLLVVSAREHLARSYSGCPFWRFDWLSLRVDSSGDSPRTAPTATPLYRQHAHECKHIRPPWLSFLAESHRQVVHAIQRGPMRLLQATRPKGASRSEVDAWLG